MCSATIIFVISNQNNILNHFMVLNTLMNGILFVTLKLFSKLHSTC